MKRKNTRSAVSTSRDDALVVDLHHGDAIALNICEVLGSVPRLVLDGSVGGVSAREKIPGTGGTRSISHGGSYCAGGEKHLSLEKVLALVLGLELVSRVSGDVVAPRTVVLATEMPVGTGEGGDGKEGDQNERQELHYRSRKRKSGS